jgi:hypothetical protein
MAAGFICEQARLLDEGAREAVVYPMAAFDPTRTLPGTVRNW